MRVDLDKFTANKWYIQKQFQDKYQDDHSRAVSVLSSVTFVPAIVVAYYIGEVCDWHPDIVKTIKTLIEFYGYTEIENKPKDAPV